MHRLQLRVSVLVAIFIAAAAFGFFCSSEHGREVLREELVTQLSGLMDNPVRIERARFRFGLRDGLRIEGQNLSTYADASGPQLLVERAIARLDVFSLLLGRFRLRGLLLDGAHLRVVRPVEGEWTPKPIARVVEAGSSTSPELENRIRSLRAFEPRLDLR